MKKNSGPIKEVNFMLVSTSDKAQKEMRKGVKALAFVIGWRAPHMSQDGDKLRCWRGERQWGWQVFDYRDWRVIGPIAERYDCFPTRASDGLWYIPDPARFEVDTTPQKVIASCVINGAKKCTP